MKTLEKPGVIQVSYVIVDLPDNESAAAVAHLVQAPTKRILVDALLQALDNSCAKQTQTPTKAWSKHAHSL